MKPKFDHRIHRPNGPWIPAASTDIKKRIARELRRLADEKRLQQDEAERIRIEAHEKVKPIGRKVAK